VSVLRPNVAEDDKTDELGWFRLSNAGGTPDPKLSTSLRPVNLSVTFYDIQSKVTCCQAVGD